MTSDEPVERIVAAAILQDGVVYTGPHHSTIIHYVARCSGVTPVKGEQGFVTSRNRFVGRREARRVATVAGQCEQRGADDVLMSEELWAVPDDDQARADERDWLRRLAEQEYERPVRPELSQGWKWAWTRVRLELTESKENRMMIPKSPEAEHEAAAGTARPLHERIYDGVRTHFRSRKQYPFGSGPRRNEPWWDWLAVFLQKEIAADRAEAVRAERERAIAAIKAVRDHPDRRREWVAFGPHAVSMAFKDVIARINAPEESAHE